VARGLLLALLSLALLLAYPAEEAQAQMTATLSIAAPADANEGDSATTDKFFTVTLSAGVSARTSYQICLTGTATRDPRIILDDDYPDGVDYQAIVDLNGTTHRWNGNCYNGGVIAAGQTSDTTALGFRVIGDTDAEDDETVIATLAFVGSAPTGVTLGASATHTILDDDTPTEVSVSPDWALTPSGLSDGDKFRLLFVTSTGRDASATDIATYNTFVQTRAKAGHSAITDDIGDQFTVVGSTSAVDARGNTGTTGTGVPIYWLNGDQVADNYADFYDGSWDSYAKRNENGATLGDVTIWTGSNDNGTKHSSDYLGHTNVQAGQLGSSDDPFTWASGARGTTRNFYGLSPVFTVKSGPEVSVRLMVGEGENRNADGEVEKPELDATVSFPLSLDAQPAADMTVCVDVVESGDTDRVASADEGIKTVSFTAGVQTGSIDVTWTDNTADDLDSVITVTAVASSTAGCSSTDQYTVSGEHGSEKVRITDDEATGVSLAATDIELGEGDASNTAVLTVSLGRGLIAGESLVARITLATSTGARLPGHATPDFAVTATGTGVALSNQTSVTPLLTFTGSDSNTVQTATVTLTPIANRDDGDAVDEAITATLSLVTGTGSGTVVTGGGAEVVSGSSVVTLSIDDDEAAPAACPAQNDVYSEVNLRILENGGVATYCMRLTTAPSGGNTIVTLGRDGGNRWAANFSPATLTFTSSNYMTPQLVTVTGADEPNTHRNRPDMRVTHTANGGGYSSQALGTVRVEVDDAPEVEAWFDYDRANASVPFVRRPNTVMSSNGLTPARNMYPGYELTYVLRLSNRPEPGGTVTVTATVASDKRNLIGLSLTGPSVPLDGPAYQTWATNLPGTLTVTFNDGSPASGTGCSNWHAGSEFEYHDSNGRFHTVTGGGRSETWDNTADTPWECWRKVWVVRKPASRSIANTCADITHTASGGGLRQVTVDTVRVHIFNADFRYGRNCSYLTENTLPPQNSPAEAAPEPTESVANVQVTAVDDASVSVTWEAVPHATSYDVSWSAESSDSLSASAGALPGVTGTSATIRHDAPVAMTLTVTVTPEHVDQNGDTQQLDALAATATLAVGPGSDALSASAQASPQEAEQACVSNALLADVDARIAAAGSTAGVERWTRVKNALTGQQDAIALSEVEEIYERRSQNGWSTGQWDPVIEALECLETASAQPAEGQPAQTPTPAPTPPPTPEISITAGSGVTEGSAATFTVTATPAPAADLDVTIDVSQSGDFAQAGSRTVTISTTGSATFTVATTNDSTDEPDGSVTATVSDGTGYTVSSSSGAATVAVADDDVPEISIAAGSGVTEGSAATFTVTATPAPAADLDMTIDVSQSGSFAQAGSRTVTVTTTGSATFTVATTNDSTDEPDGSVTATLSDGTGYTVSSSNGAATVTVADDDDPPPPTPEISIAAGAGVTEGSAATFTVTATPPPAADLDVTIEVSQSGDYASTGSRTVTISTTGSATFTVATTNDSADEPNGSVTATVSDGAGYTVSSSSGAATVAVADDDDPPPPTPPTGPPTVSVSDASASEAAEGLRFVVTLSHAHSQAITFRYGGFDRTASAGQDFTLEYKAFTLAAGATSLDIVVPVIDDNTVEQDETLNVYVYATSGITIPGYFVYATGTITDDD